MCLYAYVFFSLCLSACVSLRLCLCVYLFDCVSFCLGVYPSACVRALALVVLLFSCTAMFAQDF